MKKQILLIIFGLSSFLVNAQGNLQFNQVLTYSGSLAVNTSTANYTVPNGKVWKVEFAEGGDNFFLQINNIGNVDIQSQPNYPRIHVTFWLKANDSIKCVAQNYAGAYFISIIEYNIIP